MPRASAADDLIHQPEAHLGWRESYYWNFYDPSLGLGMWHSVGKRPYKGHSGYAIGFWGLHTLCGIGRDHFERHSEEHLVAGLRYHCVTPLEEWRITYEGALVQPIPRFRLDPSAMLPEGQASLPTVPVRFDLTFRATSPAYAYRDSPDWKPLFSGHVDQTGRTTGTITIGDQTYAVDGLGARDRSWGTRDWAYPLMWRFVDLASPSLNLMLWYTEAEGDVTIVDGFVHSGGSLKAVCGYGEVVRTEPAADKPTPKAIQFWVETDDGERYQLEGEVLQIMPVVFARLRDGRTVSSWNDRSLVRFRLPDGTTAFGNVEFGQRLKDDQQ